MALAVLLAAPALRAQIQVGADAGRLMSPTAGAGDLMGSSVSVDGEWAVVSAPYDDNAGTSNAGTAYVFRKTSAGWIHSHELLPGPGSNNIQRGASAAIHGDVIVVGSHRDDSFGFSSGTAEVYVRDDSASPPVWVSRAQLFDPEAGVDDRFGYSVAAHDDWILIGITGWDENGGDTGAAALYRRDRRGTMTPLDDTWTLSQRLVANPQAGGAQFGWSVDLTDTTAVIGAAREAAPHVHSGASYVFARSGETWSQAARLLHPASDAYDRFGESVAIDGSTLVVGAPGVGLTASGSNEGASYVFEPIAGTWTLTAILTAPDAQVGDQFATSVDVAGDAIVAGAVFEDSPLTSSGAAYLFRRGAMEWESGWKLAPCASSPGDELGGAVSLDEDDLIVGAAFADAGASDAGAAFAWHLAHGRFARFVLGDGSGIDCPCNNESLPGLEQGCLNSTAIGGRLSAWGTDSAAADDVRFSACGLPALKAALLFSGTVSTAPGVSFGDGIRAAAGQVVRRGLVFASPEGTASWGPGLGGTQPWSPGTTYYFQAWYRDPVGSPCGTGFNLTSGVSVDFQP